MAKRVILNSIERKVIILLGDLLITYGSLNLFINHAIDKKVISFPIEILIFVFGIFVYLFLSYVLDFYNLERTTRFNSILSQSIYITGLYVTIIFLTTLLIFDTSFLRWPLFFFLVFTPTQIFLWRMLFKNTFKFIPTIKKVLYIYDNNTDTTKPEDIDAINGLDKETFYKTKISFSLDKDNLNGKNNFLKALEKIDSCIINIRDYNGIPRDLEKIIIQFIEQGKEVISFTSFYENIYEALPIKSHNDSFYEILNLKTRKIRYLQSLFSISANCFLIIFVGTFFLMTIPFVFFLNKLFNKGPLLYTQERVGKEGKIFKIYKYRSMVVNAEKDGAQMATENDNRITPFGKILRKFRIDELPQIISIVNGDMMFIGPRPERKFFVDQLNQITPFYNIRHIAKPGITGWAQVKYKYGENLEDSIKKLEYDLFYIKNKSITLDLRIIFKTITTILFSRGV